ncbi:2-dehydropantoate 2-reductase N-terminal domain-containing protein [Spongiactinospora gelatinilytica]
MIGRLRALVVGAGALGQVFGAWLAAGGAQVGYLVKHQVHAGRRGRP